LILLEWFKKTSKSIIFKSEPLSEWIKGSWQRSNEIWKRDRNLEVDRHILKQGFDIFWVESSKNMKFWSKCLINSVEFKETWLENEIQSY
jgi:hypothetical protein